MTGLENPEFAWIDAEPLDGRDTYIDTILKCTELENRIEELFLRELQIPDRAAQDVLNRFRSPKDQLKLAFKFLKQDCPQAADTLSGWQDKIEKLFEFRHTFVHRSRRYKFDQFSHTNRNGNREEINFDAVEETLEWFRDQGSDEWFIFAPLDVVEKLVTIIDTPGLTVGPLLKLRKRRGY
ncbi:hypothetical protein CEP88_08355 [Roseobacter denitrificans]|uniref:Uncharacterized protein n=1 Tax=Roseobacter denitrificans (strain ATCC 33942 / OCh 114) TaxID=375451 RepID=Q161S7_ROSDO|nr:hypothetical protein [Roseobacter denitrificans]ABG33266.1 hypothetical protein RD1_3801 [Roseobacter denitrificans OCh 114]AVL52607.1 hypothetical protein CEP88_08355 [Roseobacter denitrificans]SFG30824.1 hypothetical protein SAMN05443635_112108 [Roseobacter denitrificans OCh 114]